MPRTAARRSHRALLALGISSRGHTPTADNMGPEAQEGLIQPLPTSYCHSTKKPNLSLPSVCVPALYPVHKCGEAGLTEEWLPQADKGKLISHFAGRGWAPWAGRPSRSLCLPCHSSLGGSCSNTRSLSHSLPKCPRDSGLRADPFLWGHIAHEGPGRVQVPPWSQSAETTALESTWSSSSPAQAVPLSGLSSLLHQS